MVFCTLSCTRKLFTLFPRIRHYATIADLPPWPKKRDPTPFEIFGFSPADYNLPSSEWKKRLKSQYQRYVKLYHPDVRTDIKQDGVTLSPDMKRARFDKIQEAYDILKDPRRRVAYTRYAQSDWDSAPRYTHNPNETFSRANFEAFRRAQAHRSAYSFKKNEPFWQAGTWEDYYQMRYKRKPPTKEEIEKNKYKILAVVLAVTALLFLLQMIRAFEKLDEAKRQHQLMMMASHRPVVPETNDPQFSRIMRFLTTRRSTKVIREEEHDNPDNRLDTLYDDQLLTNYAKAKVQKWDREEQEWEQRRSLSSEVH